MGPRSLLPALAALAVVTLTARHCRPDDDAASLRSDTRYILVWVPFFGNRYYDFGDGSPSAFAAAGCKHRCELVSDPRRLPLQQYDALLFHGFEYYEVLFGVPRERSPHQFYVFMSLEAATRSSIPSTYAHFYNISMTYRLDSDIPWPYFAVMDRYSQQIVAPNMNPQWVTPGNFTTDEAKEIAALVAGKKHMAAWFVSNCHSNSGREALAQNLIQHGVQVDTYGKCGQLQCPVDKWKECVYMVGKKYYFYLAFENSLCTDYVTEKCVTALSSGAVPVILSGGNLTRFLPPGSYVDARALDVRELAARLLWLIQRPAEYAQLLSWRARYRITRTGPSFAWPPGRHPLCQLCDRLHEPKHLWHQNQLDIRHWWQDSACIEPT